MSLSKEQIARYSRQLILPEIGVKGQERLLKASVLIVGTGGLGSPASLYLAAAGVGRLGLVDPQTVEVSNLHRQILHGTADVGCAKVESAKARLLTLNPQLDVIAIHERLDALNALRVLEPYELVVDGSDNFPTRYLVNDACVLQGKPLVHGGVIRFEGQVLTILPRRSACLRCVFPEPPQDGEIPNCQTEGVLGSAAGIVGTLMAHEALRLLLGVGAPLTDRLLVFEGRTNRFREVPVRRNLQCTVCGEVPAIRELVTEISPCLIAHEEAPWPESK